jgi:hypothetical protein
MVPTNVKAKKTDIKADTKGIKQKTKPNSNKGTKKPVNQPAKKSSAILKSVINEAQKNYFWIEQNVIEYIFEWSRNHTYLIKLKNTNSGYIDIVTAIWGNHANTGFRKYGQIRLEIIAEFDPKNELCRKRYFLGGEQWKKIENTDELNSFAKTTWIKQWGRLKSWDARVLFFAVLDEKTKCHFFSLYNIEKLKKNCNYFINKYGAKVYQPEKQKWGVSYVPVDKDDRILESCRITNKQDFLKCFEKDIIIY